MSRLIRITPDKIDNQLQKQEVDIILNDHGVFHGYIVNITVDKIDLKPLIGRNLTFRIADITEIVYRN